jgi:hypothetical protein
MVQARLGSFADRARAKYAIRCVQPTNCRKAGRVELSDRGAQHESVGIRLQHCGAEGARINRKLGRNPRTMRLTGELSLLHQVSVAGAAEDFLLEISDAEMNLGVLRSCVSIA